MNVQILQLLDGARRARGLTVIIDVFRAFSVECYAAAAGAQRILAVGDIDAAYALKRQHPDYLLIGERGGSMCEGFDCGNSPSQLSRLTLSGRGVIHTTSAGTQGVANALHADEIITGSLVNARAIAGYIRARQPETVSLVCMGLSGKEPTDEDTLCAEYIAALLRDEQPDIARRIEALKSTSGAKFFDPARQTAFPTPDFAMCTQLDKFPFVLRAEKIADAWEMHIVR